MLDRTIVELELEQVDGDEPGLRVMASKGNGLPLLVVLEAQCLAQPMGDDGDGAAIIQEDDCGGTWGQLYIEEVEENCCR